MEKLITFLRRYLIAFVLMGSTFTFGQSTITLQPDQSSLVIGSTVSVPILVTSTCETLELYFSYDKNVLTPAPTFCVVNDANFVLNTANPNWSATTSIVIIRSHDLLNNHVLNGLTPVATLYFIYNGGSTVIHTRKLPDAAPLTGIFNDYGDEVTPYTFTDATFSGPFADITSVTAGGNWNTPASWDLGHVPNTSNSNVIINSSTNPLVITSSVSWPGNVKINPTGKLTVNSGVAFALAGNMTIDGAGPNTGSFADLGTTNITGSSTVKRYMVGDWVPNNTLYTSHLVSSPVAVQSNTIFTGSLMNKWNEVAYNWDPMTMPFETMAVGKGYAVSPASPGINVTFSGALNTGNTTISGLTLTINSGINSGFNLVGNPFASSINWNSSITRTNVNPTAWVWNGGAYVSYLQSQPVSGIIAAEQAFFVQATGAGSMMIPNSVRTHGGTFLKADNSNWLTLKVEGNKYWDQTQVSVNPLSTNGYEGEYDALKLMGSPVAPQLFCMIPDIKLSINSLPSLDESSKIELGFRPGVEGSFTITAQDLETFTASNEFYLVDLLTNTTQNLKTNPVYTFNAAPGQLEHRFNLTFSTVGIGEIGAAKLNIYAFGKVVNVEIPAGVKGDIVVYNLLGSEIARKAVEANSLNKINLNVPSGYYLVKVNGVSYTANGKVFIK